MPVPTPVTLEWLYDVTAAAPAAREADMRGYSDTRLLEEHAQAGAQRRQLLVAHATTSEAGDALESRASLRALEWATQELLLLERVIGERGVRTALPLKSAMVTAPLNDRWQITIPLSARDALDLQPRERVGFVVDRGVLRVVNATALERIALGAWAGVFGVDFEDSVATERAFDRLADHVQRLLDRRAL
jgi:bifunctional DNA-binding transcriptional regulator/antitoxin component of YhaV-PrlF toxin-antitoxin module